MFGCHCNSDEMLTDEILFSAGNLIVVIVVTLHWRMRSITKFCMGNLAFANLCVAIFCIYQNLSTFLQEKYVDSLSVPLVLVPCFDFEFYNEVY